MTIPRSKFGNVKTEVDGIVFHSKKEAKRYGELRLLERAGVIANLQLQPRFPLNIFPLNYVHAMQNGNQPKPKMETVGAYIADFSYNADPKGWREVVEDVKGMSTPMYRLKKKLVEALYNIEIVEV